MVIEYDKFNHKLKVDDKEILISNEAYITDNILEKTRIIAADLGLRLSRTEQDVISSWISVEINELIATKLAKYNLKKGVTLD